MLDGFPRLLFSEAWSGSIGGGLAIGGVRVCFVSGLDGFALLGRCVARVSRLGEDEGELERTAYCTCVRVHSRITPVHVAPFAPVSGCPQIS